MSESTQLETKTGTHCWYELMTSNSAAALDFYGHVMGWGTRDMSNPAFSYTLLTVGDKEVAGVMDLPKEACSAGAKPGWLGYILVSNVDDYCQLVEEAGGTLLQPGQDIPKIGRFAIVADPQGAPFVLFKNAGGDSRERAAKGAPGHIEWPELHANDPQTAFTFYHRLFGWKKTDEMDVGPAGTYHLYSTEPGTTGGIMSTQEERPFWLFYVNVDDIDAAVARVKARGGRIDYDPMQVPTGAWATQGVDPQGAKFGLVGPKS